eukprot:scpid76316/ scgid19928/ Putative enzymatic polyprotein; Protease; Reverse transcriptase; Ribonuclease H
MLRIKPKFHEVWRGIGAKLHVMEFIKGGLHLPFGTEGPPAPFEIHNIVDPQYEDMVQERIEFMIRTHRIIPARDRSKLLGVSRFARSHLPRGQLVLNLRELNKHLARVPNLMSRTLPVGKDGFLKQHLQPNDWMAKMDLRHGYSHFEVHPDSQAYLGLTWAGKYYTHVSLPYGLSWSTYMFNETMDTVLMHIKQTITDKVYAYADDWLVYGSSYDEVSTNFFKIQQLFDSLGLSVNLAKCSAEPTQRMEFVGVNLSTSGKEVSTQPLRTKLVSVLENLQNTMAMDEVPVRVLAVLQGQMRSLVKFGAPEALLEFPVMLAALRQKSHWGDSAPITRELYAEFEELSFLLETLIANSVLGVVLTR